MADSTLEPGIRPTAIEIIPVADVVAITTHYNSLIRKLEDELTGAQAEAALAEERLLVHPAAGVIDDDFESFVLWATQTRLIDIHRDDADRVPEVAPPPRRAPVAVEAVFTEERPAPPTFHEYDPPTPISRPEVVEPEPAPAPAPPRSVEPPTIATPTTLPPPAAAPVAAPPVTASPVPPAAPTARRSSRRANGTTVVTRPGTPAPPPASPAASAAPSQAASPVQSPAATSSNAAAQTESFWQPSRTRAERADRPSRAERDAHRRLGGLPSTLMLQAGAVFVIVALLVLKLG